LSGTRIPDGAPGAEAKGRGSPQSKPSAIKPENEGQQPPKTATGVAAAEARNSSAPTSASGPALSQKIPFGGQPSQASQLNTTPPASFSQNQLLEKAAELALDRTASAREVFRQTAINLGLPQDNLSVALLIFARYLSLPIKPAFIGLLRREILNAGKASSPQTAGEKAALDSEALAAVIAADKGVALSPEALNRYASFLLPPALGDKEKEPDDSEEPPDPIELQAIAEKQEQKDDFLRLLNAIPGRNGQYWLVFPFSIKVKGTELNVFLRLLKKEYLSIGDGEDLIVDISGPKRQWRCFLKKSSGKFSENLLRADIRVYPECSQKELLVLQKEAESFFGGFDNFEEIQVRNGDKIPSWAQGLSAVCLPSISEDV